MEIVSKHVQDRVHFLSVLSTHCVGRIPPEQAGSYKMFLAAFVERFPLRDWIGRNVEDFFKASLEFHALMNSKSTSKAKINIYSPTIKVNGWECERTVLAIHCDDSPFLVDTLSIVLSKLDEQVQVSKSTVFSVGRNSAGGIENMDLYVPTDHAEKLDEKDIKLEALVYFEISPKLDSTAAKQLEKDLQAALSALQSVVGDYRPMLSKLDECTRSIRNARPDLSESVAFLYWLKESHFTFLGYSEFDIKKGTKGAISSVTEVSGSQLGLFKVVNKSSIVGTNINGGSKAFYASDAVICFSKSTHRSSVHRDVYPDYIIIKRYDDKGEVIGETRFLGFYTYSVSSMSPSQVPILRQKIQYVLNKSKLAPQSHDGKRLNRLFELHPKDELFQASEEELYENLLAVHELNERNVVRVVLRQDAFEHFVTCFAYVPRDLFSTRVRLKIQDLIGAKLGASSCDATTFFSEAKHARAHLVFKLDEARQVEIDTLELEKEISDLVMGWGEHLAAGLIKAFGEKKGTLLYKKYSQAFSGSYQDTNLADNGVSDISAIESLEDDENISLKLYETPQGGDLSVGLRVLHLDSMLELSDVIPILENLGFKVLGEDPSCVKWKDGQAWVHDFLLKPQREKAVDISTIESSFYEAFEAIWSKRSESDAFNKLVVVAGLDWRQIMLLRAYANYMKQTLFHLSLDYIAETLGQYPTITELLVSYFETLFTPSSSKAVNNASKNEAMFERIGAELENIKNLNEDQVFRRYREFIQYTLRTNYYQKSDKDFKDYLSIKFNTRSISDIPEPRPLYEIYVYSPRIEGVHLRAASVARGGLRWSDRMEDYRTEVLGLVKAQQVKNAVIVPAGAKGGFVAKKLPVGASRAKMFAEGVECYKTFIRGLLDITDNISAGERIKPINVVCRDDNDPYLVVAADKGTATFSDIANEISLEYKHWLGDAFASGGSQGYDHKKMGITAKGAWVSVQAHFRGMGVDIQNEEFSVIGIGDMGGDVFGNGMLLSEKIRLKAAFNHLHIFIDPEPNAAESYKERNRLFNTPGSSWADYSDKLISKGGGIFERSAKFIELSPQMQKTFGIAESKLTPTQLINRLLKSEIDLIWNGGIGTYVKSSAESSSDIGDKANDSLRVNGSDLKCKVFGEGGNLGMSQRGRIEFSLNGGLCNTDFIDNAAGVDCSDHEVNIKILLDQLVESKKIGAQARNELLEDMTESVSELVLESNYRQAQAIDLAMHQIGKRMQEYIRYIEYMESSGRLDRSLEFLPSNDELSERMARGLTFTRPELSVLLSYAKVQLKETLIDTNLDQDKNCLEYLFKAFPASLRTKYEKQIVDHKLRKEIIATQIANDFVNKLGITSLHRLCETTGASIEEVVKAFVVANSAFELEEFFDYIKSTDHKLPAAMQRNLITNLVRRARRAARWFLKNRREGINVSAEIESFSSALKSVKELSLKGISDEQYKHSEERAENMRNIGVSKEWISTLSSPETLFSGLGIVEVQRQLGVDVKAANITFYTLMDILRLDWLAHQLTDASVDNYWQAFARESYIDDLEMQLRRLTSSVLNASKEADPAAKIANWQSSHSALLTHWDQLMSRVESSSGHDYAMFSVALKELSDLTHSTETAS